MDNGDHLALSIAEHQRRIAMAREEIERLTSNLSMLSSRHMELKSMHAMTDLRISMLISSIRKEAMPQAKETLREFASQALQLAFQDRVRYNEKLLKAVQSAINIIEHLNATIKISPAADRKAESL